VSQVRSNTHSHRKAISKAISIASCSKYRNQDPGAAFFAGNDAWLACAAITHNLTRAAGHLAGPAYAAARPATIRARLITIAARLAHAIHLHLPEHWPW